MNIKTLFILFYFPPFSRVGGRRWAKHIKYFNLLEEKFHVLAGDYEGKSPWDDDIKLYEKKITRIPISIYYPYFKKKLPKNIFQKIRWKISLVYNNYLEKKYLGNFWDDSKNYEDVFYKRAVDIIKKENITHVCLSVGPYSYSQILIKLKIDFPNLKIILDYRDPWGESLLHLSSRQLAFEKKKQINVLEKVDVVLTVNETISSDINKINSEVKTITLPHSVDDDYYKLSLKDNNSIKKDVIVFIYGGEIYNGLDNEIRNFIDFFNLFSQKSRKKCLAELYVRHTAFQDILTSDENIKVFSYLNKDEFKKKLIECDFILLFKSKLSTDAFFSSKFYEILCLRKPILFFGNAGIVSDFILKNELGLHITNENIEDQVSVLIENLISNRIPDINYDISKHTFAHNTKKLIDILKNQTT